LLRVEQKTVSGFRRGCVRLVLCETKGIQLLWRDPKVSGNSRLSCNARISAAWHTVIRMGSGWIISVAMKLRVRWRLSRII